VWSNPRPGEDDVRRYYSREYRLDYKGQATPSLRHTARSGRGALNRCRDMAPFLRRGDRVLDAGAGGGEVVYVLRKLGFDAMGLEPDEHYAKHARETLGVPVETGFVQDRSFPPARFDVITMYHALEHVEDPVGILKTLRGWLPEGGRLIVEVPNVEATCIHPRHRFHFAHFYSFNQATLEATGRTAGFEPLGTSTSADGGNLITVFQASQGGDTVAQGFSPVSLAGNYDRIVRIVHGHTAAGYYLSASPYAGPLGRLRAFIKDSAATRGRTGARDVLDGLIQHA
jgi:SAM-dependent methyltransferase